MKKLVAALEKWGPLFFGVAVAVVYWLACVKWRGGVTVPKRAGDIVSTALNVAGIAVAFISTIQGILLSIQESTMVKRLREMGVYESLLRYFTVATHSCLLVVLMSAAAYWVDLENAPSWVHWVFPIWMGLCAHCTGVCYRIVILFSRILHT